MSRVVLVRAGTAEHSPAIQTALRTGGRRPGQSPCALAEAKVEPSRRTPRPAHGTVEEERKRRHSEPPQERDGCLVWPGLVCVRLWLSSLTGWRIIFSYSVGKMAIKSIKKKRQSDNPNNYFKEMSIPCTLQACFERRAFLRLPFLPQAYRSTIPDIIIATAVTCIISQQTARTLSTGVEKSS